MQHGTKPERSQQSFIHAFIISMFADNVSAGFDSPTAELANKTVQQPALMFLRFQSQRVNVAEVRSMFFK